MRFESPAAVMQHAIGLARRGLGFVEPNPAVGAVVVDERPGDPVAYELVAEGWHERFGGPHAEVHALQRAAERARGATLFVTLEPCCHEGKTPPCTRAVLAAGIAKVVVGTRDPAPHVDGGGIRALREAGVEVEIGVGGEDAAALVAPFVTLQTKGRPWVHAKWAMTLDGRIASRTGHSRWISGERSRRVVHDLRGRMDAVVVGAGTVRADDPLLTTRLPDDADPPRVATRVVLDGHASLPLDSQLVRTAPEVPCLLFATEAADPEAVAALSGRGVEVATVSASPGSPHRPSVRAVLAELGRRHFTNVLVEGGGTLLGSFSDAGLVDEVHAFVAPKLLGAGRSPVEGVGLPEVPRLPSLERLRVERLDDDVYWNGIVRREE